MSAGKSLKEPDATLASFGIQDGARVMLIGKKVRAHLYFIPPPVCSFFPSFTLLFASAFFFSFLLFFHLSFLQWFLSFGV